MKSIVISAWILAGLLCGICAAAPPETLSLADLANRPDRWPAEATIPRDLTLKSGAVVHAGDKVHVMKFDGTQVFLIAQGNLKFVVKPEDCGLLDAANQAWAALTPAQRAVDLDSLPGDPSLWPVKVTIIGEISCNFGKLPPGTEVSLYNVTSKGPDLCWPNSPNRLNMSFEGTDVISRARQLVLVDPDKRPSRIAAALKGIMVDADGKPYQDGHIEDRKIFAFYYGAGWCPPCLAFSPDLVNFASEAMPKNPELLVVMINADPEPDKMLEYMKKEKMQFPAVPMKDRDQSSLLKNLAGPIMPDLVVVDRFGKVLATNDDLHGNRGDPEDTLNELKKLLAAQPAKN